MHKNFEKISNNPFGYYDTNKDNVTFASSIDNDIVHFYRKDIVIIIYECKIIEGKITDYNRKNIYIKSPEKVSEYTDNHEYGVLSSNDLLEAFKKFLERKEKEKPLNTTVTNKEYSVRDRKKSIRNILHNKRKAYLEEFIEEYNRPYLVVTFLGILEMVKEKEVIIKQDKNFDKILVELR